MVPFADLFNHKAAVVQLGGGYMVEDVCFDDESGSEQGSGDSDTPERDSDQPNDSETEDLLPGHRTIDLQVMCLTVYSNVVPFFCEAVISIRNCHLTCVSHSDGIRLYQLLNDVSISVCPEPSGLTCFFVC